jgi:hypothetical protein
MFQFKIFFGMKEIQMFFFGTFCCGGLDIKGSVWPDLADLREVSLE